MLQQAFSQMLDFMSGRFCDFNFNRFLFLDPVFDLNC